MRVIQILQYMTCSVWEEDVRQFSRFTEIDVKMLALTLRESIFLMGLMRF